MTDDTDPLEELRAQVRATREAAERLAGETAAGFSSQREHQQRTEEVQALASILQSLKDLIPADLEEQFRELLRQVLLLVRALIDWWVERIDRPDAPASNGAGRPVASSVQDIPID